MQASMWQFRSSIFINIIHLTSREASLSENTTLFIVQPVKVCAHIGICFLGRTALRQTNATWSSDLRKCGKWLALKQKKKLNKKILQHNQCCTFTQTEFKISVQFCAKKEYFPQFVTIITYNNCILDIHLNFFEVNRLLVLMNLIILNIYRMNERIYLSTQCEISSKTTGNCFQI